MIKRLINRILAMCCVHLASCSRWYLFVCLFSVTKQTTGAGPTTFFLCVLKVVDNFCLLDIYQFYLFTCMFLGVSLSILHVLLYRTKQLP